MNGALVEFSTIFHYFHLFHYIHVFPRIFHPGVKNTRTCELGGKCGKDVKVA